MFRRAVLACLLITCWCGTARGGGEVVYALDNHNRVTSFRTDDSLPTIASTADFAGVDSLVVLANGNVALLNTLTSEVWVCSPTLAKISYKAYKDLGPIVSAAPLLDGQFVIAGKKRAIVISQPQTAVLANKDLSSNGWHGRTIRNIRTRCSAYGLHVAMIVDSPADPDVPPGVWFGRIELEKNSFTPTALKEDMAAPSVSVPFVNGMWLIIGNQDMSIRAWGKDFAKKVTQQTPAQIVGGVPLHEKRFALLSSTGEVSVWTYTNDAFVPVIPATKQLGEIVQMQVNGNGDLIVASKDGKISIAQIAGPTTMPATGVEPNKLVTVCQKSDLGQLIGLGVGTMP
jgi:hypothetical protein